MTIDHIYKIINKAMLELDNIDFLDINKRRHNQKQLNGAYKILDNFRDELIRENIKKKQEGNK